MPLASLDIENRSKYIHTPGHDLESLLLTALGIVTFTTGPCGQIRSQADYVPLSRWYNETDRGQLRKDKAIDLICYDNEIHRYIPDYWKPFSPYLRRLAQATWPGLNPFSEIAATHDKFREILQDALTDLAKVQETPCNYARITRKRSRSSSGKGNYPYKSLRGDVSDTTCLPQLAVIKPLSEWTDSVNIDA
jgi:hypothetical protein